MKKEECDHKKIILRRSARNKTKIPADVFIKQEEIEDKTRLKISLPVTKEVSLSEETESGNGDPSFESDTQMKTEDGAYCKECNFMYDSQEIYLAHQRQAHKTKIPNNYCNLCCKSFKFDRTYKYHMKKCHGKGNKYNYCDICVRQFIQRRAYTRHMRTNHGTKINTRHIHRNLYPDRIPDINDPNCFCATCDHTFSSQYYYNSHLKKIHKITPKSKIIYADKIPDINDPNNFCIACDRTFTSVASFQTHLLRVHNIDCFVSRRELSARLNSIKPEINIKDLYCNICLHKYSKISIYRAHMFRRHDVIIPPKYKIFKPNASREPDINDPNNYCCVCDRNYRSRTTYSSHLIDVHFLKPSKPKHNNDSTLNVDSLKNYCLDCDRLYSARSNYRTHLLTTHNIKLVKTEHN